jgi:ABC-2 type transport system permease protein
MMIDSTEKVWWDGKLIDMRDANVSILSYGLHYGWGVFEGLRALMIDHVFRVDLMLWALSINLIMISIASVVFLKLVDSARDAGALMAIGE